MGIRAGHHLCRTLNRQGAASLTGIGRASVLGFAREGAKAIIAADYGNDDLASLEAAVRAIAPNCSVTTVDGDASDEAVVQGLCDRALKDHGRLDVRQVDLRLR